MAAKFGFVEGPTTPAELTLIRFLVCGIILLPIAINLLFRDDRDVILFFKLAFFQGAPLVFLMSVGIAATNATAAGLTPALIPFILALNRRSIRSPLFGVGFVLTLSGGIALVFSTPSISIVQGCLGVVCFAAASALGATYFRLASALNLSAIQLTAVVSSYSIPIAFLILFSTQQAEFYSRMGDVLLQGIFQGFLLGICSIYLMSFAIKSIGPKVTAATLAFHPLAMMLLSQIVLSQRSVADQVASVSVLSIGIVLGVLSRRIKG